MRLYFALLFLAPATATAQDQTQDKKSVAVISEIEAAQAFDRQQPGWATPSGCWSIFLPPRPEGQFLLATIAVAQKGL